MTVFGACKASFGLLDFALAQAFAKSNKPKLALPAPNNVMVTDAQGNTIQTTENNVPKKQRNADISVPKGLSVDASRECGHS